jgi:hypothetical protein
MPSKQTEKESTTPTPPRSSRTRRRRAALMAGIAALVVATTVIARYGSSRASSAAPSTSQEALTEAVTEAVTVTAPLPAPAPVAPVQPPHAARAVVEKPKHTPVVTTARSKEHSVPSPPPPGAAASGDGELASRSIAAEAGTVVYAAESTATPDAVGQGPVTITGCLETTVDGDEFRLIDTEGADAPKTRTWRSGFLKKRAAPVQLVEFSDRLTLRKFVGRRVAATGLLTSRELHVRSFQSAGSSCH